MFAQFVLDLSVLAGNFRQVLGFLFFGLAVLPFIWPRVRALATPAKSALAESSHKAELKRRNVDRSSDTPPPAGFSAHLQIIEEAAPNATPDVWWNYAKAEMTEAEVALAEAKLARRSAEVK